MKKIILMSIFSLFTFGCNSTDELPYIVSSLERFREKQVPRLVKYMENDLDLSKRDINTFYSDLENFDSNLEKLKKMVKKDK